MSDALTALEGAIHTCTNASIVTHYVLVASVIHDDGGERVYTITAPGQHQWQTHGLLAYEASAQLPQPEWTIDEEDDE